MLKIITHPGSSHRDEVIAIAIILGYNDGPFEILRREPTREEIDDPGVYVVDVGGVHDPSRLCFDHHQERGIDCAAHLVARHFGVAEQLSELYGWFDLTNRIDTTGPMATAKHLGIDVDQFMSMRSPVEAFMLRLFERMERVDQTSATGEFLALFGADLVDSVVEHSVRQAELDDRASIVTLGGGVTAIVHPIMEDPSKGVAAWRKKNAPDAALSISPDDRGAGWALYRFDDHPAVDLSRLADHPQVVFAHLGGFIAKTRPMGRDEAIELATLVLP